MKLKLLLVAAFCHLQLISVGEVDADQSYTVEEGDSLSLIAYRFYRDQSKWPLILNANRDKVSGDGALLLVGVSLVIPDDGNVALQTNGRPPTAAGNQIDLVTGDDYKPYTDDDLPQGGLTTEVVAEAFRRLGYEPVVDFINWSAGYDLTERNKFAATFPYKITAEREEEFIFSDPVSDELTYAFWHRDRDIQFQQLSDLEGYRVCRYAGYFIDFLEGVNVDLFRPKIAKDCWTGLADGSVDFVLQGEFETLAIINELDMQDDVIKSDSPVDAALLHVIFPKSSPDSTSLRDQFNQELRAMTASGEIDEISERHIKAYYETFEVSQN